MGKSYYKLWVHDVWATKNRQPLIKPEVKSKVHDFIYKQRIEAGCPARIINGMPNPVTKDFQIKSDQVFSRLEIYSLNGKKVIEEEFTNSTSYRIQTNGFPPGMYILQLMNEDQIIDRIKFVKQ